MQTAERKHQKRATRRTSANTKTVKTSKTSKTVQIAETAQTAEYQAVTSALPSSSVSSSASIMACRTSNAMDSVAAARSAIAGPLVAMERAP